MSSKKAQKPKRTELRNKQKAKFELPTEEKFKGHSSLIGEVVRVGGADPKVGLKLPSGRVLSCEATEGIAKALGHRLYEYVTCKGFATWDYDSGQVVKFRIDEIGAFERVPASEAFQRLADAMPSVISRWRATAE